MKVHAGSSVTWKAILAVLHSEVHDTAELAPGVRLRRWTVTSFDGAELEAADGRRRIQVRCLPDGPATSALDLELSGMPFAGTRSGRLQVRIGRTATRFAHYGLRPGASTVPQRRAARKAP